MPLAPPKLVPSRPSRGGSPNAPDRRARAWLAEARRRSRLSEGGAIVALDLLLFSYVFWFRTHGISETFWLHADQIRDWEIALRRLADLPLVGPPSLAGGNTAGPVYYWVLWLSARIVGPWVDFLPHAGAIGIAFFQSAADVVLFHALARRLDSRLLAVVIILAIATAGHDATISSTIWNPPVANAFAKISLGLLMLAGVRGIAKAAAVSATAWLAVQAHTPALPVALPVLAYVAFSHARKEGLPAVARRVAMVVTVIAVLQVPWLVHQVTVDAPPAVSPMQQSLAAVVQDPLGTPRPIVSAYALVRAVHVNSGLPIPLPVAGALLLIGGCALMTKKDPVLRVAGPAPLLCAIAIYSLWQGSLNENYWYLAVAPSAMLCALGWIAMTGKTARTGISAALLMLVLVAQPGQAGIAWSSLRTPVYGAFVRGARSTLMSGIAVREVRTTFPVPAGVDPAYVYSLLGGRLDGEATERVVVSASGAIRFETVSQ